MGNGRTYFGINPDDYGLGDDYAAPTGYDDPNEGFLNQARLALQARELVAKEGIGEAPEPITIPRVKKQTQDTSLLATNPESGKWLDLVNQLGAVLSNAKKKRYLKKHPGSRVNFSQIPPGQFNARAKAIQKEKYDNEFAAAKENADIGLSEARINESAMSRHLARLTAQMGQMMPTITRAAMRDPKAEGKAPVYKQKLVDWDKMHDAGIIDDKEWHAGTQRILGAGESSSDKIAQAYSIAAARFNAGLDAKEARGVGKSYDEREKDITYAKTLMADFVKNDFFTPEQAADKALQLLEQAQRFRTATGKDPTMTGYKGTGAGVAGPTLGAAQPGAPVEGPAGAPTGISGVMSGRASVKRDVGGLSDALQKKLAIYAQVINQNPERRAEIKQKILKEYGLDPDQYIQGGQ